MQGTTQSSVLQASAVSDYNLWGEGDLFNAPQPVLEEPVMGLDPMTVAISMISCGDDGISPQSLSVSDIESSIESGQLLSEVFYECRKDILAKDGNETPLSEVLSINIPTVKSDENMMIDEKSSFQKSVSSSCLRSMENVHEPPIRPNFLDFPVVDFDAAYGMRRAFSEGDIKVNFLLVFLAYSILFPRLQQVWLHSTYHPSTVMRYEVESNS